MDKKYLLLFCLLLITDNAPAFANECGKALNGMIQRSVQSAVTKSNVCSGLKKEFNYILGKVTLGVDKTHKAEVANLKVCLSRSAIEITGIFDVTCKTSDAAVVKGQISEKVSFAGKIKTSDCGVESLSIQPSGEIGKIIVSVAKLEMKAKTELDGALKKLCQ